MFSSHTKMFPSGSDYRDTSLSAVPPHNSQNQTFICDRTNDFRSCSSGHVFNDSKRSFTRDVLPSYVTQQSDSGFGSALSSGSSCSYLPPPPPYRMRIKQHKIYRSSSDSKYFTGQQSIISLFTDVHRVKGGERWNSQCSLSPSPSMSTVSCPEYPDLQERLHRLALARDSLSLQVSVLSEQVGAQKEKIRDLEALLAAKHNGLNSTEELFQHRYQYGSDCSDLKTKNLDLVAEVSDLKTKFATLEQEMNETEKNFKNDVDHTNSSLHDMAIQKRIRSQANEASEKSHLSTLQEYHSDNQNEEMKRLRHAIQRLIADNELKNHQINSLRNALNEQLRSRSHQEDFSKMSQCSDDLNSQIRRLLSEEPYQPMTHSSSYPVRLCSSSYNRMAVQPSSSYTSSLSAAAVYQRCPKSGNRRLYPSITGSCSEHSYRSPPSPAARQLAAELDELRLTDRKSSQNKMYSSVSLSRGLDNKALSTLALPMKKHSLSSVISAVESDDEIVRGGTHHAVSPHVILEKPSKRGRTGSSIRNLLNKLTRSISQEQNTSTSKTGSAIRSTQFAQVTEKFRKVELFPSRSQFNEWRLEQLTEWMKKAGLVQYVAELAKNIQSGRDLLNMSYNEFENVLGIKRALLRKRLNVLLRRIENEIKDSAATWDVQETQKWLDDIGLPQYKEVFLENMIDGVMIVELTATDLAEMRVINAHHYLCISRSVQYLKTADFKSETLIREFDESIVSSYPCPESALRWTHAVTCEWLRKIDLAEFTPHLLCAGIPGLLMVCEPTFTAETLAEILQIPPHKTLLRRHLTTHFNQLIGQRIVAEKRDFLASGISAQLIPGMRVKIAKKGSSLSRKKSKTELILESDDLLCSPVLNSKLLTTLTKW